MKITDTMVLALLKKGFGYEIKNADMEFETEVPLTAFGMDSTEDTVKMKLNCKIESARITISEQINEF